MPFPPQVLAPLLRGPLPARRPPVPTQCRCTPRSPLLWLHLRHLPSSESATKMRTPQNFPIQPPPLTLSIKVKEEEKMELRSEEEEKVEEIS